MPEKSALDDLREQFNAKQAERKAAKASEGAAEKKPKSQKRRRLLGGLIASAAALIAAVPIGRRISSVDESMEVDSESDLSSKRIELARMERPESKEPGSQEVRKRYFDFLKEVTQQQLKFSPEFQAQLDSLDGSTLEFGSSDKTNFNVVKLEVHSKGKGGEESVLYTRLTMDPDGNIQEVIINNGLTSRVETVKARRGLPLSHVFGPDEMRDQALEIAKRRLPGSGEWTLVYGDSEPKNNGPKDDSKWEINRTVDQSGYKINQKVKVGQIQIKATKPGTAAQR